MSPTPRSTLRPGSILRIACASVLLAAVPAVASTDLPLGWSTVWSPPAPYLGHTATLDPVAGRIVDFGGLDGTRPTRKAHGIVLGEPPRWIQLGRLPAPLSPRGYHSAIVDVPRHRLVVFGGWDGAARFDDVWTLDLASGTWTRLEPAGPGPSARHGHRAIYDATGERMIVFGGYTFADGFVDDVWALDLVASPAWTLLSPAGAGPAARGFHATVADPGRNRMIVHGGVGAGNAKYADAWALSLGEPPAWSPLSPTGPSPGMRMQHAAVLDPTRDRMLLVAGHVEGSGYVSDTWALSLAGAPAWTAIATAGTPPSPRVLHTLAFDPVGDRLVLQGGSGDLGAPAFLDTWALALGGEVPTWAPLEIEGNPPPREDHVAVFDAEGDRMILHGGSVGGVVSDELWEFRLDDHSSWRRLTPGGPAPSARMGHRALLDPSGRHMIIHGGSHTASPASALAETWSLSLDGDPPAWTPLAPAGPAPPPRRHHVLVHDAVRNRLVVFGGEGASGALLADLWTLPVDATSGWTELTPDRTPPDPRKGHMAATDPYGDRMLFFDGVTDSEATAFGPWQLNFSPIPRWAAFNTWLHNRAFASVVADEGRRRALVLGGGFGGRTRNLWSLSLVGIGTPFFQEIYDGAPTPRSRHVAVLDPARHRMLVHGGADPLSMSARDVEVYSWHEAVDAPAVPGVASDAPRLRVTPNPGPGRVSVEFQVPRGARTSLRVHDVVGRLVRVCAEGWFEAGIHVARWDGRRESGTPAGPGVYFAVLVGDGRREAHRFVLVP